MIELKDAVKATLQHVQEAFSPIEQPLDLRLEEVELSDDETEWRVTVSFLRRVPWDPNDVVSSATMPGSRPRVFWMHGTPFHRDYKQVVVDALNGRIRSLRVRELV